MKLTIAQIDKIIWQGDAESVSVPGENGEMTILAHHMPLVTILKKGKITVKTTSGIKEEFQVGAGFLEIGKSEIVILV